MELKAICICGVSDFTYDTIELSVDGIIFHGTCNVCGSNMKHSITTIGETAEADCGDRKYGINSIIITRK
jgi:hypothetical protein